ncbi:MAG TPA: alpha/beta fold hydrolase [Candidatus Dormibacteraeota bacterium]|nr:alpha/beta fold hydrolase [Candidatus Dormibacteraeota bacterium]
MVSEYAQHPLCKNLPSGVVEPALREGLAYVATGWTKAKQASTATDPMAQFLCDCIIDALCADQGLLALQPQNGYSESVVELLAGDFSERRTPGGGCYYVRNRGTRPLLLINATGTSIAIWKQFLADSTHDFKIILPRRRGSELFRGGLQQHITIETDSTDLASIIDAESIEKVDVLAWCNGARVAIDLANCRPQQIASIVLLAPMLKGVRGITSSPSNFERDLQPLLDAVCKEPSLAPFFSKEILKQPTSPDWKRWVNAPASRAQALFALPAKEHADAMMAMLTDAQSFINIARRVASDESYPMDQALGKFQARTMVIMGADDGIVSNELVSSAMKRWCTDNTILKVSLKGSGHYIQDLQYHYLRWVLTEFLDKHQSPTRTARMSVETLGRSLCTGSTRQNSTSPDLLASAQ